jgi:hypothetical protein
MYHKVELYYNLQLSYEIFFDILNVMHNAMKRFILLCSVISALVCSNKYSHVSKCDYRRGLNL